MKFIPAFLKAYSDSSFTNPHEVVLPEEPKDCRGNFTHMGAKYWGFETLRHKATSMDIEDQSFRYDDNRHHWFDIGFKAPAKISNVKVSTRWFTGNQVPCISVVAFCGDDQTRILERVTLAPDQDHEFNFDAINADSARIECYHEGGISQVNFFGELIDEHYLPPENLLESAEITHVSNDHFGHPSWAVKGNREEDHMVGWESARWGFGEQCVFALKAPAKPTKLIVDTYLHRLNPPLSCHLFGVNMSSAGVNLDEAMLKAPRWQLKFDCGHIIAPEDFQSYMQNKQFLHEPVSDNQAFSISLNIPEDSPWVAMVPFGPLGADQWHEFNVIELTSEVSHVLYMHYPNGGVHGLKLLA